ncbi:glycosyltransferase [Janibacter sp. YIM B02568]|uniref:glycosyltransferase n=1 Tax=Janibacter endophyticus TaxID=2806261 RepID=UPI00194E3D84|nr:glycosyltransferase [Janibacter endophyticus]MBM6546927.1 glycosyltransferase [Janibacter endophyticus]
MTDAPPEHRPPTAAPSRRVPEDEPAVSAVLLASTSDDAAAAIAALLAQTAAHPATDAGPLVSTLLLVDSSPDGLGDLEALAAPARQAGASVLVTRLPERKSARRALRDLVASLPTHDGRRDLVWILTSRCRPQPEALTRLVGAVARGVAIATPKLVDVADPGVIVRQGIQVTRAGRLVPTPRSGERDQGQHDDALDVIAGPLEGLLVDRQAYLDLDGHHASLGELGADLDLGWRAHRRGLRVVAVPDARVAVVPRSDERRPGSDHRAQARSVALARGTALSLPLRALGGALVSGLLALGLLLIRRPDLATEELALVKGSLSPRLLPAVRRRGSSAEVGRRDLSTLFVADDQARRRLVDDIRGADERLDGRTAGGDTGSVLRSPLPYLLLAAVAMSAWAGRFITGELRDGPDGGLVGGELLGGRATARSLFAAWRDAWNGSGVGAAGEQSPALLLLAAASWVVERLPGGDQTGSPAGVVLTVFVLAALPLAALVAYRAARVVTPARWVRALLGLGWVATPVAAAAAGEGRVGALVAIVLLPRVGAGVVRASRAGPGSSDAVRTALWAAVVGVFVPALGLLVVLVGLGLLLRGGPGRRGRGIALAAVPLFLAGPWLLTLRAEPLRLLAGWGTTSHGDLPEGWRLAAAAPGGPGEIPLWWYLPVLLLAILGLVVGRAALSVAAAVVAVLGAAGAVVSPFVVLGTVPAGTPGAGLDIHPWPGTGGLLVTVGLLVLAGLGVTGLPAATGRARQVARALPAVTLAVGVLGSAALVALTSFGDGLTTWRDERPRIAIEAAEGPLASRTLVLARADGRLTSRLVGREAPQLVRDLPRPMTEEGVSREVAALLGLGASGRTPVDVALGTWGIGYVTMHHPTKEDEVAIDSTPGLRRMSDGEGTTTWSVRPDAMGARTPSRARLVGEDGSLTLDGLADHSASVRSHPVQGPGRIVVGEAVGWTEHAVVTGDRTPLVLDTRSAAPTYAVPEGVSEVEIAVDVGHATWKWVMLGALVVALYLALPTDRRTPREEDR